MVQFAEKTDSGKLGHLFAIFISSSTSYRSQQLNLCCLWTVLCIQQDFPWLWFWWQICHCFHRFEVRPNIRALVCLQALVSVNKEQVRKLNIWQHKNCPVHHKNHFQFWWALHNQSRCQIRAPAQQKDDLNFILCRVLQPLPPPMALEVRGLSRFQKVKFRWIPTNT